MNTQWYAVYTRPRWEKKVAEHLAKNKFESYCPLNRVLRQWHDRKKFVQEPLFASYVFVRTEECRHVELSRISGIVNLVYWLRKPAVIREDEIEAIRHFTHQFPNVQLEKTAVNVDDRVRVIKGPLITQEGNIIAVKSRTVKIALPSLGYIMVAEVEKQHIEIIPSQSHVNQLSIS
ncbi:MAG TPA: UpxY family transcription antiterminator [Puia sp.]|jgi:transcription antitermination factor NusG|nr:UpxY family transcription antiterminator [Puia sp.]